MCTGAPNAVRKPEETLRDLMVKDLGVYPDAKALRLFIKHRWASVSTLAHAIHDEKSDG